jgi:glycosyltransferase involved in cell wall biosynthesis
LSVITPVLNGQDHIAKAIENVIEQDCPYVEHVIVDGGSTDGTLEIVRSYARSHSHIAWFSGKDGGQSEAMNKGIQKARGGIVGFLNCDDRYEPNVFDRVLSIFARLEGLCFVAGNCCIWDANGIDRSVCKPNKLSHVQLLAGWNVHPHPVNPTSYFYHKKIHELVGGYDPSLPYNMDLDFILRCSLVARMIYFDELWGNFYVHKKCKTYDALTSLGNAHFDKPVLEKYRRNLAPAQKIALAADLGLHEGFRLTKRLLYYLLRPDEFISKIKRTLGFGRT